MAKMDAESVDVIVCDPPYGLEFMGKNWDRLDGGDADAGFASDPNWMPRTGENRNGMYNAVKRPRYGKMTRNLMVPESEADKARLAKYGDSYAGRRSRAPDLSKGNRVIGKGGGAGFTKATGKPDSRTQNEGGSWFGGREGAAPNYYGSPNVRCRKCDKWKISGGHDGKGNTLGCQCEAPDFPNVKMIYAQVMQEWHYKWAVEAFRVLKPGGHLLSFGGTRTYHRMVSGIEDAGFEIRDTIVWLYGSGFPKSLDAERAIAEEQCTLPGRHYGHAVPKKDPRPDDHVCPATPDSLTRLGYGTSLKPAHEPIVVARKPLEGTVAANVLRYGTGALNIDACRIGGAPSPSAAMRAQARRSGKHPEAIGKHADAEAQGRLDDRSSFEAYSADKPGERLGRWPANVILSHAPGCELVGKKVVGQGERLATNSENDNPVMPPDRGWNQNSMTRGATNSPDNYGEEEIDDFLCVDSCPVAELDRQSGVGVSHNAPRGFGMGYHGGEGIDVSGRGHDDFGGVSRFFYVAKASRSEREYGLGLPLKCMKCERAKTEGKEPHTDGEHIFSSHPTVKPVDLMRYLVTLVTPPGGTVLDPFLGSGTTGIAARIAGFNFIGIEREAEYMEIARARIEAWKNPPSFKPELEQEIEAPAEDFFA
jgi:DNA modification methylase